MELWALRTILYPTSHGFDEAKLWEVFGIEFRVSAKMTNGLRSITNYAPDRWLPVPWPPSNWNHWDPVRLNPSYFCRAPQLERYLLHRRLTCKAHHTLNSLRYRFLIYLILSYIFLDFQYSFSTISSYSHNDPNDKYATSYSYPDCASDPNQSFLFKRSFS